MGTKITKIVADYDKEKLHYRVKIDMLRNTRSVSVTAITAIKSEDSYMHVPDLEAYVCEYILKDDIIVSSNKTSRDEQKILWRIRIYFDDKQWKEIASYSGNPYNPDYLSGFYELIER